MKNHLRRIVIVSLAAYICMAASCDKYRKAGELAKDVAAGVLLAQQTEVTLHKAGKIDDQTHQAIQMKFSALADAGMRLDKAINQTHNAGSATDALKECSAALDDLSTNGLFEIKDQQTVNTIRAILLTVQTTLNNIAAIAN